MNGQARTAGPAPLGSPNEELTLPGPGSAGVSPAPERPQAAGRTDVRHYELFVVPHVSAVMRKLDENMSNFQRAAAGRATRCGRGFRAPRAFGGLRKT
jgi:hypothetical protein